MSGCCGCLSDVNSQTLLKSVKFYVCVLHVFFFFSIYKLHIEMDLWAGWSLGSNFMLITVVFKTILATNPSCDVFLVENVELSKQGQKKVTFIALHWKRKGINKDHFTFNDRCSIYLKQAVSDTAPGKSAELSFFFFFLLNSYVPSLSVLGLLYNSPHPKKNKKQKLQWN